MLRLPKRELLRERMQLALLEESDPLGRIERPLTRADCLTGMNAARPCPFVSCTHHLYVDVHSRTGAIKFNRPELGPEELAESCSLDIADRGGATLEDVGAIMNVTRERVRQIEVKALAKVGARQEVGELREHYGFPLRSKAFDAREFASIAFDDEPNEPEGS